MSGLLRSAPNHKIHVKYVTDVTNGIIFVNYKCNQAGEV